jgi:hypothetical protein
MTCAAVQDANHKHVCHTEAVKGPSGGTTQAQMRHHAQAFDTTDCCLLGTSQPQLSTRCCPPAGPQPVHVAGQKRHDAGLGLTHIYSASLPFTQADSARIHTAYIPLTVYDSQLQEWQPAAPSKCQKGTAEVPLVTHLACSPALSCPCPRELEVTDTMMTVWHNRITVAAVNSGCHREQ